MIISDFYNLLTLLRNAITGECLPLPAAPDWQTIVQQARMHGVEPLVYDVALRLPENQAPDKRLALQMKQVCLYQMQQQTLWIPRIKAAVSALRNKGIEPVLLKGFGLADLYPKPYLRSWGDADIWVGIKAYHQACGVLRDTFPEAIHHDEEYEELKHYCFVFPDNNAIEMHRIAMDFPTVSEDEYWQTLEVPAMREGAQNCLDGLIRTPAEPFNILFCFLHMWEHFCSSGMPLKQVLDIALLVQRDYTTLPDDAKRRYDEYLRNNLKRFYVSEAWRLVAYVTEYVTGVRLPLFDGRVPKNGTKFLLSVLNEGQCRVPEYELGGSDRFDERERAKRMPVWRRKLLTLSHRFAHAKFLMQYDPAYGMHTLAANIRKGLRRTLRRERMIDY